MPSAKTPAPAGANLLTLDAAARHLGVSTRTVRRRVADGSLRAFRVGPTLLRVDAADVDALLVLVPAAGTGT